MQVGHCLTTSSSWWFRPGHHTDALALSRHFVIPWCASCNLSRTCNLMVKATTSRFPLVNRPCCTVRSLQFTISNELPCDLNLSLLGPEVFQSIFSCRQMLYEMIESTQAPTSASNFSSSRLRSLTKGLGKGSLLCKGTFQVHSK